MLDFRSGLRRAWLALIASALVALTPVTSPFGGDPTAAASSVPLSARLAEVAAVNPGSSLLISSMVIDSVNHRGYVIDRDHKRIEVYDIAGDAFIPMQTLSSGVDTPVSLALDEAKHRLYVGEGVYNKVSVIDIDPASATVNTVLKSIPTGGKFPSSIAVGDADTVFVANRESNDVSILNTIDDSHLLVSVGTRPTDIVVDPASHTAYVSSLVDSSVMAVRSDGTTSNKTLTDGPRNLEFADGRLLIATEYPVGSPTRTHIESYDPSTWTRTAISPALAAQPTDFVVVDALQAVYVAYVGPAVPEIQILRAETLESEGTVDSGRDFAGITVDRATNTLFASESYTNSGANVVMYEAPSVDRFGGADRFAVSAAVSAATFSPGVPVAYVASGAVFADALSGSAAAGAKGGPVLLTAKDTIPAEISAELTRLRPAKIVVLGGIATVSDSVEDALNAYTPTVARIGGVDRFAVSAAVSAQTYASGVPVAYVASGAVFSDALSGSAAAGHERGPVLLTTKDTIPAASASELTRLKPGRIVVLGGVNTIADSVVATLQASATTTRIAGADRSVVSAAVSAAAFPPSTRVVYVASGAVFADALSGSAAAIARGGPVLLVTSTSIPPSVAAELSRLDPTKIVVLGGPNTIAHSVVQNLAAYLRE